MIKGFETNWIGFHKVYDYELSNFTLKQYLLETGSGNPKLLNYLDYLSDEKLGIGWDVGEIKKKISKYLMNDISIKKVKNKD